MNAWKVTLPLAVAFVLTGFIVGDMTITLVGSENVVCGTGLGGGSGMMNANAEAACAPILAERNAWGLVLIFVGLALVWSTVLLRRGVTEPVFGWKLSWNRDRAPRMQSPPYPGYRQQPDGSWIPDPRSGWQGPLPPNPSGTSGPS